MILISSATHFWDVMGWVRVQWEKLQSVCIVSMKWPGESKMRPGARFGQGSLRERRVNSRWLPMWWDFRCRDESSAALEHVVNSHFHCPQDTRGKALYYFLRSLGGPVLIFLLDIYPCWGRLSLSKEVPFVPFWLQWDSTVPVCPHARVSVIHVCYICVHTYVIHWVVCNLSHPLWVGREGRIEGGERESYRMACLLCLRHRGVSLGENVTCAADDKHLEEGFLVWETKGALSEKVFWDSVARKSQGQTPSQKS